MATLFPARDRRPNLDPQGPSCFPVFDGVVEEVADYLLKRKLILKNGWTSRSRLISPPLPRRAGADGRGAGFDCLPEIDRSGRSCLPSRESFRIALIRLSIFLVEERMKPIASGTPRRGYARLLGDGRRIARTSLVDQGLHGLDLPSSSLVKPMMLTSGARRSCVTM